MPIFGGKKANRPHQNQARRKNISKGVWNWHDLCLIVRRKRFTFHIQLNYPNHTIEKQLKTFRHGVAPLHSAQHRKFYARARCAKSTSQRVNKPTSQQVNKSTSQQVFKPSSYRNFKSQSHRLNFFNFLTS